MIYQNGKNDKYENLDFQKPETDVSDAFGNAIRELKLSGIMRECGFYKQKGASPLELLQFLLLLVFRSCGLYQFLNSKRKDMAFSKNTYYRFLGGCRANWHRFLLALSARVTSYFSTLTEPGRVRCLVLDDSVIPRERSKCVELLSWVHDHVMHKTVRGFTLLALGWTDGYSFVPVSFNMLASAKEGMRINGASTSIDRRTYGYRARMEAVLQKPEAALRLVRRALDAGIRADCVLMDSWFTTEPFIGGLLDMGTDAIGRLKNGNARYWHCGHLYTLKMLSKFIDTRGTGSVFGSLVVATRENGIPVKIVFVQNRNRRSEYIAILSTDISLDNGEIVRRYGNRWSIEVFFRASKSLLKLGTEYQCISYDATVCSTAIVFTRFILLEWIRRQQRDAKTFCELFRICCEDIRDMDLATALASLAAILTEGLGSGSIRITDAVRCQLLNWYVSQPAFIRALFPDPMWEV